MHGVFTGALQKVFGAIQGVEHPEPFRRQGFAGCELFGGGFLTEQGPGGRGEGCRQARQQVLIHRQIRRAHRPFAAVVHT